MRVIIFRSAIITTVLLGLPFLAFADTLFLSPANGTYSVGRIIPVTVNVSTPTQAVNAFSTTVQFSTSELQVDSISKSGSIVALWVEEPSFSNQTGIIKFEGVLPNPGYTGSRGNLLTINFRPVKIGTAQVKISAGAILANDGNGTNIMKNLQGATYTVEPAPVKSEEPVKPKPVTPQVPEKPLAPEITSYDKEVLPDGTFTVKGKTSPNVDVVVVITSASSADIEFTAVSNDSGQFVARYESSLPLGTYSISAYAKNSAGLKSEKSEQKTFIVKEKTTLSFAKSMAILAGILFVLLISLIVWDRRKIMHFKKKVKGDLEKVEDAVDTILKNPRSEVDKDLQGVAGPKIVSDIKESLTEAEKMIVKEIRKVEKDVENE